MPVSYGSPGRGIGTAVKTFNSPHAYVQGRGVVADVGTHAEALGDSALLVADGLVMDLVGAETTESLREAGIDVETELFGGECSVPEIERLTDLVRERGTDFVIGAGGGKTLDTVKAVTEKLGVPMVSMPTVAASDSPTSALTVVYTEEGEYHDFWYHDSHPALVLVDTQVIANAPTRFFRSGLADAMATWFENDASYTADGENFVDGRSTRLGHEISRLAYELVREHGVAAVKAVERDLVTESVEAVVEANILLSGLGFESGGVSGAHSIHNGLTALEDAHHATHGEKVSFGIVTHLVLEGRDDAFVRDVIDFCIDVGIPVALEEVGVEDPTEEELMAVAEAATVPEELIHDAFDVTPEDVRDAMVLADAWGREVKAKRE